MKKYYLILALAFGLVSCGGDGETSSSDSVIEEIDNANTANEIIGFNNDVIDHLNESTRHIDNTASFAEDFAKMVKKKQDYHAINNLTAFIGRPLDMNKIVENAPSEIPESIKTNLKNLDDSYKLVEKENKIINKYRKNQDYKDDNWQKGQESLDKMNAGIIAFYASKELVSEELRVIGDKAEEKILEDHPLKDPILAAKKDLNLLDDLQTLMFAEKLDREAIKIAYDNLEKSSKQHKEEFNEVLEEQKEKDSYDGFHEDIEDFLGGIRKVLRYNRELKTGDYNSISVDYKSVISGYNSFVN